MAYWLGHRRELIIRNRSVWPTLFHLNVFTAPQGIHFYILFLVTVAGVVPWGSPKNRPDIVHNHGTLYFTFGPLRSSKYSEKFEKSENIIGLDSYFLNGLNCLNLIWIYIRYCMISLLKLENT